MKVLMNMLASVGLLLGGAAFAASDSGTQCGGLEKLVNQPQIEGLTMHKMICRQMSQAGADKLHLPLFRTVVFHYGRGERLATLTVGYSASPETSAKMLASTGQTARDAHALLKQNAKDGNPAMVKLLKDWEAGNREVEWPNTKSALITYQEGVANATGLVNGGQNMYFMMNFPATSIDDATNTAKAIFGNIHFDQIAAGRGLAPLGVVGAQDQSGVMHPGD